MIYGIAQTIYYTAWDTENNTYRTGDAANHILRWNKDGSANVPANLPIEVDSVNQPGLYKLDLEESETRGLTCRLHGLSSTPNTVLIFQDLGPIRLPNETFNSTYGLALGGYIEGRTLPTADYALEATTQSILTTGGAGPWTTGNTVVPPTAQDIWNYTDRILTDKQGFSLDKNGLDLITTWAVTIDKVNETVLCGTNMDMRGTDNANTVVPDTAGTAASLHQTTDNKIDEVLTDIGDINFWSDTEMAQFRYQVGIDGTTEQPTSVTPNLSQFNHATDMVRSNLIQVNGSTDILVDWARSLSTIVATQVTDSQENPTPTDFFTDLTDPDMDYYKNRAVIVYDGPVAKQASLITGYALVNGQGKLTVAGFTRAPVAGDTLLIV